MCHVNDPCASSPWPLDQTIIRWMVEMEWSCASLHASMHWGGGAREGQFEAIFVAWLHATVLARPPGSAMWKEDTIGMKGRGAFLQLPLHGRFSTRPRLLPRGFWVQIHQVSGPSLYLFVKSLHLCFPSCAFFSLFTCIPSMWLAKEQLTKTHRIH
jgi:hypothetical protein